MKIRSSQFLFLICLLAIATFVLTACGGGGDTTTNNNYYGGPTPTPSPTTMITEVEMVFQIRNSYNDDEFVKSNVFMDGNSIGTTDPTGNLTVKVAIGIHDFIIKPEDATNWNEKTASSIEIKESQTIVFSIVPKFLTGTPMKFSITNRTTGNPIDGVQIFIFVSGVQTKTGTTTSNGICFIKDIPSGTIKVVVKKPGYGDYTVDGVVISGTEPITASYKMIPQ